MVKHDGPQMVGLGLILILAATTGCATILHGSSQTVSITSSPSGARATILPIGIEIVTPGEADLSREQVYTIRFELEGYRPTNGYVDRVDSKVSMLNYLIGGLIGRMIDSSTGAWFRLTPDPLHVTLEPTSP